MMSRTWSWPASRRIVAMLLSAALLVQIVSGCGGSGGDRKTDPSAVRTWKVEGTADISEISNTTVIIHSAWQETAGVGSDGSFSTIVSSEGAQLVFASDVNENLRGLAVSIPSQRGRQANKVVIDAESTALAIVFMTPGIMTTEPEMAAERIESIRNLTSFYEFLMFLTQNLPDQPISVIAHSSEFMELSQKCVDEWFLLADAPGSRAVLCTPGKGDFFIEIKDQQNLSAVQLDLVNYGWRCINVFRRELDSDGYEKRVVPLAEGFNSMPGGQAASWGNLFTWRIGEPTKKGDTINLSSSGAAKVEYWICGPGWMEGEDNVPSSIPTQTFDAWGKSIFTYLLFPIVDLLVGASKAVKATDDVVGACWAGIKSTIDASKFERLDDPTMTTGERTALLIDITVDMLEVCLECGVLVDAGLISPAAAVVFGKFLFITTGTFSACNIGIFTRFVVTYPKIACIEVEDLPRPTQLTEPGTRLRATAWATGSVTGHVADVELENLTSEPITARINPGMSFSNSATDRQDLTVIREIRIRLNPWETKWAQVDGTCISLHKSAPYNGDYLTPYVEQRADLVALCRVIEETESIEIAAEAVWVITDDSEPYWDDLDAVINLFVAAGLRPSNYPALQRALSEYN